MVCSTGGAHEETQRPLKRQGKTRGLQDRRVKPEGLKGFKARLGRNKIPCIV